MPKRERLSLLPSFQALHSTWKRPGVYSIFCPTNRVTNEDRFATPNPQIPKRESHGYLDCLTLFVDMNIKIFRGLQHGRLIWGIGDRRLLVTCLPPSLINEAKSEMKAPIL